VTVLPMAGALVSAAILLSGLSLIRSHGYHFAIAQQQNTTEGNGGGASGAQSGNATTTGGGGNLSISEIRTNLEQARTALQNNDTESAMMYLDLTLDAIGGGDAEGNLTSSSTAAGDGGNATTTGSEKVISMGGTGAADDYDATADE
jgi:hypothetical protein